MSHAYHNRFERTYPQSFVKLTPPISSLTIGAATGYPIPNYTYRTQNRDLGPPYVGRQFLNTNAYGYLRTRPGGRMPALQSEFARTLPPQQQARAVHSSGPGVPVARTASRRAPNTAPRRMPGDPLVDPGPIGKTYARRQRAGYTRNSLGGQWTDFDPTHHSV